MIISFLIIFCISAILAARSMKDFDVPESIKTLISGKKAKGTIIFLKKKIIHYNHRS